MEMKGAMTERKVEYPETHQTGVVSLENLSMLPFGIDHADHPYITCDLGIQIAKDGRVWICINGIAFLRFKPNSQV